MKINRVLAILLCASLIGAVQANESVGVKKEFIYYASWPVSIAGYSLFGRGLIVLALMNEWRDLKFGLSTSLIGAGCIVAGRSLSRYALGDNQALQEQESDKDDQSVPAS